jgi:putative addiction module component (TIGR02574 family)
MSEDFIQQLMTLPLDERVELAQALWGSIDDQLQVEGSDSAGDEAITAALARDAELTSGTVIGRSHEQVVDAVRSALR